LDFNPKLLALLSRLASAVVSRYCIIRLQLEKGAEIYPLLPDEDEGT
jgi:hypothetical protein